MNRWVPPHLGDDSGSNPPEIDDPNIPVVTVVGTPTSSAGVPWLLLLALVGVVLYLAAPEREFEED